MSSVGNEGQTQEAVITPLIVNKEYLGCDLTASTKDQIAWSFQVVDHLLELVYYEASKRPDASPYCILRLEQNTPLLVFYMRTDWYDGRTAFSLTRANHKGVAHVSDTICAIVPPGPSEQYEGLISMLTETVGDDTSKVCYLPRYRFDPFIKFLLKWLLESLRVESPMGTAGFPLTHSGDSYFTQCLTSIHSTVWMREEYCEAHDLISVPTNSTAREKKARLLALFQRHHISEPPSLTVDEISDKIIQQLTEIETWINNKRASLEFRNDSEFTRFATEVMNQCLQLLSLGSASVPDAETASKGYTKHRAIIVGHMVRITKLYQGALIHIEQAQYELATIFFRLIFETAIQAEYLIKSKSKRKSCRSFILASYRPEKEMLEDLKAEANKNPLNQVGKRVQRKIVSRLKDDHISQTELMNNRIRNVDGKTFRDILKDLDRERQYPYLFGGMSHCIHGDWIEISSNHLHRQGRYYEPNLSFQSPDPRLVCPLTHICLQFLLLYLEWNKSDPNLLISSVTVNLQGLNADLDTAHENSLEE